MSFIRWFSDLGLDDAEIVGSKNASLGEMYKELAVLGVRIPEGFATTTAAYRAYISANDLEAPIAAILDELDATNVIKLASAASEIRSLVEHARLPAELESQILAAYRRLSIARGDIAVAVRSSASAPELPGASFAGQQESYLMIRGEAQLLSAVRRAYASLFTARAISYREDMGLGHEAVALSVGIQRMVRSDLACSGVMSTVDEESGFRDVVTIDSSWGFGENVVKKKVEADRFVVFKPTLFEGRRPILQKTVGSKKHMVLFDDFEHRLVNQPTPPAQRLTVTLSDDEILALARSAATIEAHYVEIQGRDLAMDIEWAKDGATGELFIVQARLQPTPSRTVAKELRTYRIYGSGLQLTTGLAVGNQVAVGSAILISDLSESHLFRDGDILVTAHTDSDWEPLMRCAAAIVTDHGSRTSHAAIVARELGMPAVVGTGDATDCLAEGGTVTVSCADGDVGSVFAGQLAFEMVELDPAQLPRPDTQIMLNVRDPARAFSLGQLPVDGVGLARMEHILTSHVKVHPLALTRYDSLPRTDQQQIDQVTAGFEDKREYFISTVAQGIGTIAAAFYPRPVVVRTSDLNTNDYASLIGGSGFEPAEDNPMIGWRGACRYYHPDHQEGFELELEAIERVRNQFGLTNVRILIPFCRTPEEARQVLAVMEANGLERGRDGLQVYLMAELPSNVFEADSFAELFDGFSIGSNDLTQLVLGLDRDSEYVAPLFDERSDSVRRAITMLIEAAHRHGLPIGICGQAPSDYPDFAAFLVESGIDSISLSADALIATLHRIVEIEKSKPIAVA